MQLGKCSYFVTCGVWRGELTKKTVLTFGLGRIYSRGTQRDANRF